MAIPSSSTKTIKVASDGKRRTWLADGSLPVGITGTIAHGNAVTLSDPQGRLGTRTNTAFRHWQQGSEIVINGTASTAENGASTPNTTEVWGGVSDVVNIVTDSLRHARIDQQYRAYGKGSTTNAKAFDGIGVENKFYLAKWVRAGSDFLRMYTTGYGSLNGTFTTNANRTRGESVTISLTGGGTKTGYITMISGGFVSLEITDGSGGSSNINGATVTGDVSGATLVIDTTSYGAMGSTKVCRIYSGGVPSSTGISVVTSHNGGLIDVDEYDANGYLRSAANDYSGIRYSDTPGAWALYELEIDFTSSSGIVRQRINNATVYSVTGLSKDYLSDVKGFYLTNLGMDTAGSATTPANTGMSEDWGEIVADNDLKRIVIGNASTLATCTQIEVQRHTSWSSGEVQFVVNQGGFDSLTGKYVFAVGGGFAELLGVAI